MGSGNEVVVAGFISELWHDATSDEMFAAGSGVAHPVHRMIWSGAALAFCEQYTLGIHAKATSRDTRRPFRVPQGRPGASGKRTRADMPRGWRFEVVR